jgi:hypothetical protein
MRGSSTIRLAAGLALLLMLFGSTLSRASASDGPFITIHNRLCPVDYSGEDLYGDCHDTPQVAGITFRISGTGSDAGVTDSEGNITFADLYTGTYTITGGETDTPVETVVYCSFENEPDTLHLVEDPEAGEVVNFPAEGPSSGYICDWYHIPVSDSDPNGGGDPQDYGWYTLTIHNRICPVEYSGDDLYGDCHDNPQTSHLEFTVIRDGDIGVAHGSTDDAGDVTFENIPPGYYTLYGGVSSEFASAVVYCSIEGIDGTGRFATEVEGGFQLATNPNALGWHYVCDWYNIPFDLSGDEDVTPTPTPNTGDTNDDEEVVTDLPNTGTGAASDSSTNIVLYGLGVLALGMSAVAVRRRATR